MTDADLPPALLTDGLTKAYDDLVALHPLDLEVPAGQSVALIGHNGSGKSTFLRMAAGLLDPSGGDLEIAGFELDEVEARATTSFLPDDPVLYDDLSLREHVEYISRLHGGGGWDGYAEELCDRLGLGERVDDLPSRFSRADMSFTALFATEKPNGTPSPLIDGGTASPLIGAEAAAPLMQSQGLQPMALLPTDAVVPPEPLAAIDSAMAGPQDPTDEAAPLGFQPLPAPTPLLAPAASSDTTPGTGPMAQSQDEQPPGAEPGIPQARVLMSPGPHTPNSAFFTQVVTQGNRY